MKNQNKKNIVMIAYSHYISDARIQREAETLASTEEYEVTVLALRDDRGGNREYAKNGVAVKELDISKYQGRSLFRYVFSYLKFMAEAFCICNRMFFKEKIWAFHVHNMPNFLIFAVIIPRLLGGKLILDIHDMVPETYSSKFQNSWSDFFFRLLCLEEAICCRLANKIICTNHLQREKLVKRGIDPKKIVISMNVPDPKKFTLNGNDQFTGERETGFKLIYHGTLAKRLGIDLTIRAVKKLIHDIPGLEFYVLGGGEDKKEFKELTTSLGLEKCIHFKETVPVEELSEFLRRMDLGVVANRKDIATEFMLPVKMMEYAALEIPIVVAKLEVIDYYFSDEMVSYFEPDNVDSLANVILELYRDKSKRKRQVQMAKKFLARYGWEKHKYEFLDLYEHLYQ